MMGLCLTLYVTMPWLVALMMLLALAGTLSNLYLVVGNTVILSHTGEADRVGVPWGAGDGQSDHLGSRGDPEA
ncbi:MAG: hypothetical protein ACP5G7_01415 [Anaerolineae bacterium]